MMNVLSLTLVLTSLLTGSVFSPTPDRRHGHNDDVIVKEGHRVVVVEFDKEGDGNTKVLISPHEPSGVDVKGKLDAAGEKLSETAQAVVEDAKEKLSGPRELVCDAYGKCKHKLAEALGRTKDKVAEKAHEASGKAHEVEEHGKEAVGNVKEHGKEAVGNVKETVKEKAGEVFDKMSERVGKAKDAVGGALGKSGITEKAKEIVKDTASKTAHFDVVDSPVRISEDIGSNVSQGSGEGPGEAMKTVENVKEGAKKSLGDILGRLKEVIFDVVLYMVSPEKMDAVMGLIHMLGFSIAYGTCVWVTFVSSYILGRCLPRQQFGMVQSKIYPVYFRAMAYCVGSALLGHFLSQRKKLFSSKMEMFQGFNLLSALLMVLTNMSYLEPQATKLMFERMKIEKEEGRGISGAASHGIADEGSETVSRPPANVAADRQDVLKMNEKLKKLNTYSSALNVSTLVVLTWHLAYMGQRLQASSG